MNQLLIVNVKLYDTLKNLSNLYIEKYTMSQLTMYRTGIEEKTIVRHGE